MEIKYENLKYFKLKNEICQLNRYFRLNNKGILINRKKFPKIDNPKVSIISTVYNREKYILRFLRSIQNQFFNDIEIIFIDDYSSDNSAKIIEFYQKEDERIILLKHKKNKGTLISRNIGAIKAKGEFLIFPDSDDILSSNILELCYQTAKMNDYEMIRFNMHTDKYFPFSVIDDNMTNLVYQPELRTYLIYGYGYKKLVDGIISNKFIKKNLFIITLNNINNFYLSQNMIYFEDGLINFALHFNAKSLYLLKKIGYYYIFNQNSVSRSLDQNSYWKCYFLFLKFLIDNIKNINYEKNIIFFLINEYIKDINILNNIEYLEISEKIINIILKYDFITYSGKIKLEKIKKMILNKKRKKT